MFEYFKQEWIPVGCVPSAAAAVCPRGGGLPGWCVCPVGVYTRDVSAQGGGECLPRGVVSAGELYTTLPCEQNDLQRGVKT